MMQRSKDGAHVATRCSGTSGVRSGAEQCRAAFDLLQFTTVTAAGCNAQLEMGIAAGIFGISLISGESAVGCAAGVCAWCAC